MGVKRCPGTLHHKNGVLSVEGFEVPLSAICDMPNTHMILAHVPYSLATEAEFSACMHICVFRDPRNVLSSHVRFRKRLEGNGARDLSVAKSIENFWGQPFIPLYRSFLGWRGKATVLRYEDLPEEQCGRGELITSGHPQDWNTRTGSPSDWRKLWTSEDYAAWQHHGGAALLEESGYAHG
jgi:hypothetical protein